MNNKSFFSNIYKAPKKNCGFHRRMIASVIDGLLLGILIFPLFTITSSLIYGGQPPTEVINTSLREASTHTNSPQELYKMVTQDEQVKRYFVDEKGLLKILVDQIIQLFTISFIFIYFWHKKQATPGKMIFGMKIVDAKTGNVPSTKQYILRFFSYIISAFPLFLGVIYMAFNKEKRALHDYIAGTKVILADKKL